MSNQGVILVSHITLRRDKQVKPTKHVTLTFDATTLREAVKANYLHCKVRSYVPNPRCCFSCQRFRHSSKTCCGKQTCATCGEAAPHPAEPCEEPPCCVNCGGPHATYSRTCAKWNQEKDIISLKVMENMSPFGCPVDLLFLYIFLRRGLRERL